MSTTNRSTIIFVGAPAHGHVNPTLPVVQELIERGEQVIYYNADEFQARIEQAGARFRVYPRGVIDSAKIAAVLQGGNVADIVPLLLNATEALLPFMLETIPREAPDLLIFDSTALWGRMTATLLNVRAASSITHFIGDMAAMNLSMRELLKMVWRHLPVVPGLLSARRRLTRRYGKNAFHTRGPFFPVRGGLNIVYTARELQPNTSIIDETFRFVGPSIQSRPSNENFPFDALGAGTVVYISLGTVHRKGEFFRECFAAFADYPAQFVLSTGTQSDPTELDDAPRNFIVRPFVPQLELLQRVDAFITHGGMNSIHEGLYYGVPLLVIPHQFEQLLNARIVAKRNAGIVLGAPVMGKRVAAKTLRLGLEQVLTEKKYRDGAASVRELLRATGGYRQAADEIQSYIADARRAPER